MTISRPLREDNVCEASELLRDALGVNGYGRTVLLDLSRLQVIDSSGFAWLVKCQRRMRENGGQLILHSASPWLGQTLARLKMELIFRISGDRESALRLARSDRQTLEPG